MLLKSHRKSIDVHNRVMREMNQMLEYRWTQGTIPREDDTNLQKIVKSWSRRDHMVQVILSREDSMLQVAYEYMTTCKTGKVNKAR